MYMNGVSLSEARSRLVDGTISDDCQKVISADGREYRIKRDFPTELIPGEKVQFVPHLRPWKGEYFAGEIWLQNERKRNKFRRERQQTLNRTSS